MYITLTLANLNHPGLQALRRELHRRFSYRIDNLLVRPKVRDTHRSLVEIHTGKGYWSHLNRDNLVALVNEYLPGENVIFGFEHNHVGGIAYNFPNGYTKIV